jgi:hypothetical protein
MEVVKTLGKGLVPRAGVRQAEHLLSKPIEREYRCAFLAVSVFAQSVLFAPAALRCDLVVTGRRARRSQLTANNFRAIEQKLICFLPA